MNTTLSLDNILQMLSGLSLSNRQWLAEHLVEPEELERAKQRKSDEEWLREFQALPRGFLPTTAIVIGRVTADISPSDAISRASLPTFSLIHYREDTTSEHTCWA